MTVGPMAGERTPEQGNGDSTPVYGSFEEESIELEGEEEPWDGSSNRNMKTQLMRRRAL